MRKGHRGYIGSRPYFGQRVPQHVQNLVIRDFCARNDFDYLLSVTEHAMPNCFMNLNTLVEESETLKGVVLYSIFMLPRNPERREDFCQKIFLNGATLHSAVENIHLNELQDIHKINEILKVNELLSS